MQENNTIYLNSYYVLINLFLTNYNTNACVLVQENNTIYLQRVPAFADAGIDVQV